MFVRVVRTNAFEYIFSDKILRSSCEGAQGLSDATAPIPYREMALPSTGCGKQRVHNGLFMPRTITWDPRVSRKDREAHG